MSNSKRRKRNLGAARGSECRQPSTASLQKRSSRSLRGCHAAKRSGGSHRLRQMEGDHFRGKPLDPESLRSFHTSRSGQSYCRKRPPNAPTQHEGKNSPPRLRVERVKKVLTLHGISKLDARLRFAGYPVEGPRPKVLARQVAGDVGRSPR